MILIQALAALSRAFDRLADELLEDPSAFWKRHRAKVVLFAVSAIFSGVATVLMHQFTAQF